MKHINLLNPKPCPPYWRFYFTSDRELVSIGRFFVDYARSADAIECPVCGSNWQFLAKGDACVCGARVP